MNKRKKGNMNEFFRIAMRYKKHLEDEGCEISDYEIGHLAVICQEEIKKALKEK